MSIRRQQEASTSWLRSLSMSSSGFRCCSRSSGPSLSNDAAGALWGICAVVLWIAGFVRSTRRRHDLGATWGAVFGSWLLAVLGPIGAAFAAYTWRGRPEQPEEEPVNPEVERRSISSRFASRSYSASWPRSAGSPEGEPVAAAQTPPLPLPAA